MKSFTTTIATVLALMAHQAMAADTVIDIEWLDTTADHFTLEDTSNAVFEQCCMPFSSR